MEFNNTFDSFPSIALPSKWSSSTLDTRFHNLSWALNDVSKIVKLSRDLCVYNHVGRLGLQNRELILQVEKAEPNAKSKSKINDENEYISRSFNFDSLAKFISDTTPDNGFVPIAKMTKDDRFPKFMGMFPENIFTPRIIYCICSSLPNQSGMVPSNLLSSIQDQKFHLSKI